MKNIRSRQPCISMNFWTESSSSMWVSLKGYNISTWEIITKGVIKKAPLKAVVKAKAVIESCYWKLLWKKKNILGTQWLQKSQWVTYRICGAKVNTKSLADFFFFFNTQIKQYACNRNWMSLQLGQQKDHPYRPRFE